MSSTGTGTEPRAGAGAETRLDSWKEIAAYLGRDVRTVQRWEKSEGLPVHRHLHEKQGSVYAFRAEVDEWRAARDVAALPNEEVPPATADPLDPDEPVSQTASAVAAPPAAASTAKRFPFWNWMVVAAIVVAAAIVGWRTFRNPAATEAGKPIMIAVLPFENLSGDRAQEYFSDGITEELIVQIGRLHADGVDAIAVGSAMGFKNTPKPVPQIARELGAGYVVQGSVRRSGDMVRVSAHLIRARDDAHLWDDSYDRDLRDVLSLQKEVAEAIARGISVNLGQREARAPLAVNPRAYEAYLKGRYLWNKRTPQDLNKAIAEFQEAIRVEPNYAPAYVGVADSYALLGSAEMGALPPRQAMPLAQQAASRALSLDPQLAEAHASLAHIKLIYDWDMAGAEKEFRRAIALNPAYATAHQWYALLLNAEGRSEEALKELSRARELDPLSPAVKSAVAEAYYFARRYDRALAESRNALELDANFVLGLLNLGRAQEQQGQLDEAIETFARARTLSGGAPALSSFLAHAYALKGEQGRARELLASILLLRQTRQAFVPALYVASVYVALHEDENAFRLLHEAADERCEYLIYLKRDPMADRVRNDPRFARVLEQAGLQASQP